MLTDDQVAAILRLTGSVLPPAEPPTPPPLQEDPSVVAGNALQGQVVADMDAARNDPHRTDIAKAVAITRIWEAAEATRIALFQDFTNRYTERLNWLHDHFPYGPGIPEGTSAADRAVLMTAFSNATEKARAATIQDRNKMLSAAQRYGDDLTVRAILTVCNEDSLGDVLGQWAEQYAPDVKAYLAEWRQLNEIYEGRDLSYFWVRNALSPIRKPEEVSMLPQLVDAYNSTVRAYNGGAGRPQGAPARAVLDVSDLLARA